MFPQIKHGVKKKFYAVFEMLNCTNNDWLSTGKNPREKPCLFMKKN